MSYEEKWISTYGVDKDPIREHIIFPRLLADIQHYSPTNLLDIGCGNGSLILQLLTKTQTEKVTGIDKSKVFIHQCQKNIQSKKATFVNADVSTGLPFSDNCFDFAVSLFVINEIEHLNYLYKEISRVLVQQGTMISVCIHPTFYYHHFVMNKFCNKKSVKFMNPSGYFEAIPTKYKLSLANIYVEYFHHTIESIFSAIKNSNQNILDLYELSTNNSLNHVSSRYQIWNNTPRFLYITSTPIKM